jgi:hypothetical protein
MKDKYKGLQFDTRIPTEITVLFDPPPVLDDDAASRYSLIFMGFAHVVQPQDFIEWMFVRDLADHGCEISWLRQLRVSMIVRVKGDFMAAQHQELWPPCEAEINKLEDRINSDLSDKIRQLGCEPHKLKAETKKLVMEAQGRLNAETSKLKPVKELEELLRLINRQFKAVDLYEAWIEPYERVGKLLQIAEQKFENALRRIDEYKHGLGKRLRKAADEIIEGEFEEEHDPGQMQASPATAEMAPSEGLKVEPAETLVTAMTSVELALAAEGSQPKAAEAADSPISSAEAPLSPEGPEGQT